MSDWLLPTLPLVAVIYFVVNPAQLPYVLDWIAAFLH